MYIIVFHPKMLLFALAEVIGLFLLSLEAFECMLLFIKESLEEENLSINNKNISIVPVWKWLSDFQTNQKSTFVDR